MKLYCSGIGGIGLSAYASYQKASGHEVSGSDLEESSIISNLRSHDISVSFNQDGNAVPDDTDLFVYTLALPDAHPELMKAKEFGITQKTYFQALGDLIRESGKTCIAVCGTHGKSSTTAMTAKVLVDSGLDPSVILGTKTNDLGGKNWRKGTGDYFLVEACEYRRSFLNILPDIVLMTNVTGDHFDAFDGIADYHDAFREFLSNLKSKGTLITHMSDPECSKIAGKSNANIIDADTFRLPNLNVPGVHMQKNAQLVLALAGSLMLKNAESFLEKYHGCWRRTELKGKTTQGALLIDDYGHHPNEIKKTLDGIKEAYPDRRLVCVFQPHTHDRTIKLYNQFLEAFKSADLVIIPNIYEARSDRDRKKVDVDKFVGDVKIGSSVEVINGHSLENTVDLLKSGILKKNDLLVTMGAGDVTKIGDELL